MATQFKTGGVYTLNTINGSILGTTYTAKCISDSMEYTAAKLCEPNIDSLQAALIPYLAKNVSTKHTGYRYCMFETQTNAIKVFAYEWINIDTVTENTVKYLDVRITGADSFNLAQVKAILGLAGFPIVNEVK